MATYYDWYVLERDKRGRERKRKLGWKMTQGGALEWAAANPGKQIVIDETSGEERHDGGYVGWGQALTDSVIDATGRFGDKWKKP